jgi:hypothetical protein
MVIRRISDLFSQDEVGTSVLNLISLEINWAHWGFLLIELPSKFYLTGMVTLFSLSYPFFFFFCCVEMILNFNCCWFILFLYSLLYSSCKWLIHYMDTERSCIWLDRAFERGSEKCSSTCYSTSVQLPLVPLIKVCVPYSVLRDG